MSLQFTAAKSLTAASYQYKISIMHYRFDHALVRALLWLVLALHY